MDELMVVAYKMEHVKYLHVGPGGRGKALLSAYLSPIALVSRIQDVAKAHGFSIKAGESTDRILSLTHPKHRGLQIVYAGMKPLHGEEKSLFEIKAPTYLSALMRVKIVDFLNALKEKKRGGHLHLVK